MENGLFDHLLLSARAEIHIPGTIGRQDDIHGAGDRDCGRQTGMFRHTAVLNKGRDVSPDMGGTANRGNPDL